MDELLEFGEVNQEELAAVSGGDRGDDGSGNWVCRSGANGNDNPALPVNPGSVTAVKCPKCGSTNCVPKILADGSVGACCNDCKTEFAL